MPPTEAPVFPFDVFARAGFPGPIGELVDRVRPFSMFPPYPWGPWLYGRVFRERCTELSGDVLEAGVGWGGMSFYLGLMLEQLGQDRRVFSVDSFEGLPAPDVRKDNPYFIEGEYGPAASSRSPLTAVLGGDHNALLESFQMGASSLGLGETIVPVRGFFEDVLPDLAPGREFAFVHIDGDIYSSVMCALEHLWDRVVDGGVVVIDDFFHPVQGPLRAAAEFFNSRGLVPLYHVSFPYSVIVFKEDWGKVQRGVDGNAYSLDWLRRDEFLIETLDWSRKRARHDRRARANCDRLRETLAAPAYPAEIYDYWRSLEQFWERNDVRPADKA